MGDPRYEGVDRPGAVVLLGLSYAAGLLLILWLTTVSPLLLIPAMVVPLALLVHRVQRPETEFQDEMNDAAAATRAWPPLPSLDVLLAQPASQPHARIARLRTYANPEYFGSIRFGSMVGVYHTVAIDHAGGVHPIDTDRSFGELEARAQSLAEHIGVPHESAI